MRPDRDRKSANASDLLLPQLCLDGIDVISVGPLFAELSPAGVQSSVVVIVPERAGKDFSPSYVMLDFAQDSLIATVLRTARIGTVSPHTEPA